MVCNVKGPTGAPTPRGRDHEGMHFMATQRILKNALTDEAKRTVLRESLTRYRNELMNDEERQLLLDRVGRLRCQLKIAKLGVH
jgi:hypothetical protein